jgi:ribonuclease E
MLEIELNDGQSGDEARSGAHSPEIASSAGQVPVAQAGGTSPAGDDQAPAKRRRAPRRTAADPPTASAGAASPVAATASPAAAAPAGSGSAGPAPQAAQGTAGDGPEPAAEPGEGAAEDRPGPATRAARGRTGPRSRRSAAAKDSPGEPASPGDPSASPADNGGAGPATIRFTGAAGAPAAGEAPATEGGSRSAIPSVTFQPPQVIFQPPSADEAGEGSQKAGEGGQKAGEGSGGGRRAATPASPDGPAQADADAGEPDGPARRRRRRGSRGQGKQGADGESQDTTASEPEAAGKAAAAGDDAAADSPAGDGEAGGSRRRRRRRRRSSSADADQAGPDEPPNTVVHVRPGRPDDSAGEVQAVRGSTRLEAKRQRRREGRDTGRRRPPVITESEFLARREAVDRVMVVRQRGDRTQIGVLEDGVLVEHYVDKASHQSFVGNVYLGKVQNVLPSMEAAFVDIGKGRNAVLYAGEVNFDASGLEGESKRIESALKSGQSVLVQVTKDPVGHKGARLTSQVSLPGRYLVYVPGGSMMGISRKLPDSERTRLKQILKQVMPDGAGVIVRTAAEGASEEELAHDVARLSAQWESIERKSQTANAPELLYSEPDLTIRVVRDIFNEDFSKLVVAGDEGWDLVDEYVRYVAPHLADRLDHWSAEEDVFARYRVDEQLAKALDRKVWLPSGGSLVVDNTEAMTVVDVNTGKFTGQGGNLEETVTRNNLEAAEEIVRQLRLRDVGGIIVIDFIDMVLESNRELVLRRLLECLARDRTKHQVAEVTSLGLVQMTRKRVGSGLLEAFSEPCDCCNGRGLIVSLDLVERNGSGHRGRAGKDSRPAKESRGGQSQSGRQGKSGKQDKKGKQSDGEPGPDADNEIAAAAENGVAPVAAGEVATVAAGEVATVAAGEVATVAAGEGGGRRRRAATRQQGPPEVFAQPDSVQPGAGPAAGPGPAEPDEPAGDSNTTAGPEPGEVAAG